MGTAYTPGLTVSANTVILKTRRLPIKGEVLVQEGDLVQPDTVVARALLPGILQTVRVAQMLGIEPKQIHSALKVKEGDTVEKDQVIAETKGFLGLFRGVAKSPAAGTVELISEVTGHVGVRQPPTVIDVNAYVQGRVVKVLPQEGAVIETQGALIQGIFGVGGERRGTLRVLVSSPSETLTAQHIPNDVAGQILVGGAAVEADAITRAAERGAVGIVAGGIRDTDLIRYLGRDIGVAITGSEDIPLSIIVTEGFGAIQMANRTFRLLKSLEGKTASINGATQIRAGVIRPEIIVPLEDPPHLPESPPAREAQMLDIGSAVRIIREPYFGRLGTVVELPPELMEIESGTHARVLKAKLDDGTVAVVPRANVEIIVEEWR
jgi:pyruvate/2-oxoglutarate dehydrogenase complex dihydrolipoamide acyltransferase (E2) component